MSGIVGGNGVTMCKLFDIVIVHPDFCTQYFAVLPAKFESGLPKDILSVFEA